MQRINYLQSEIKADMLLKRRCEVLSYHGLHDEMPADLVRLPGNMLKYMAKETGQRHDKIRYHSGRGKPRGRNRRTGGYFTS